LQSASKRKRRRHVVRLVSKKGFSLSFYFTRECGAILIIAYISGESHDFPRMIRKVRFMDSKRFDGVVVEVVVVDVVVVRGGQ